MILLKWYREWLDIRIEFKRQQLELNPNICLSCEALKSQVETINYQNKQLLDKLLTKPDPIPERTTAPEPQAVPRNISWNVRRQILEREDREKAKLMREAIKPDVVKKETEELEKALDLATELREKQSS